MRQSKDTLYETIKDLKTRQWFDEEIQRRKQDCGDLFDEDTLALLIVDELGRNTQGITAIESIEAGNEYTIVGTVVNLHPLKTFNKKNGGEGRVLNVDVADDTGTCRVVLWDNDVELINAQNIQKGTRIKIINGYTKNGYHGVELNVGKWGVVEVLEEQKQSEKSLKSTPVQPGDIQGKICKIQPTRAFFRDDGEFGFVTTITVEENEKTTKELILWGSKVKEIQEYAVGDSIRVSNVMTRFVQGKKEYHVNETSVLLRC